MAFCAHISSKVSGFFYDRDKAMKISLCFSEETHKPGLGRQISWAERVGWEQLFMSLP